MKRSKHAWLTAVWVAWTLAFGGVAAAAESSSVRPEDLAASPIARLAKAIEDGDAATVAAFVRYPLHRAPPLPSIDNEEQFVAGFPVLFDDAFRREMREGQFSRDWEEVGWRGVMYHNGRLWVDGTLATGGRICTVNYQSAEETRRREALLEEERATLPPSLAGTCDLVFCFETDDGQTAGRIDREGGDTFRVLLYDKPKGGIPRGTGSPKEIFKATAVYEGSGGNHVYLDREGRHAVEVIVIGQIDDPDLRLYERLFWSDAFEHGRPAHYANWFTLLAPPE